MQTRKHKYITHIVVVLLLCIPMAFLWYAVFNANRLPSYKIETYIETEPRVYVTTYGKRYHSADCSYSTKSQHAMGEQQAISKGYTACSRCGGKASGTIDVTYTKRVEEKRKPKRIWQPIFLSILFTPTVYLLVYLLLAKCLKNKQCKEISADCKLSPQLFSTYSYQPRQPQIRIGDAVYHRAFGLGVIKAINGKTFTVRFDHETKDFIHPDIFDSGQMKRFNR